MHLFNHGIHVGVLALLAESFDKVNRNVLAVDVAVVVENENLEQRLDTAHRRSRPDAGQIGYFRSDGSVETASTRIANNVTGLAQAVVLNYMALHNEVGMFDMVLPGHSLGAAADLDQLIAFAPIR